MTDTQHLNEDQEPYAGKDMPDPWAETGSDAADRPDGVDTTPAAIANQTPEAVEFGRRAVESGDPDGEDRPNGDPRTVGQPVGGGERSPEAPEHAERGEDRPAADDA